MTSESKQNVCVHEKAHAPGSHGMTGFATTATGDDTRIVMAGARTLTARDEAGTPMWEGKPPNQRRGVRGNDGPAAGRLVPAGAGDRERRRASRGSVGGTTIVSATIADATTTAARSARIPRPGVSPGLGWPTIR